MRPILLSMLLLASLLPLAPAEAARCDIRPYLDCHVAVGPASAGITVDTRWWPIQGEFYHCVDVDYPPFADRILCQWYILA